jgi:hypothetical protein
MPAEGEERLPSHVFEKNPSVSHVVLLGGSILQRRVRDGGGARCHSTSALTVALRVESDAGGRRREQSEGRERTIKAPAGGRDAPDR